MHGFQDFRSNSRFFITLFYCQCSHWHVSIYKVIKSGDEWNEESMFSFFYSQNFLPIRITEITNKFFALKLGPIHVDFRQIFTTITIKRCRVYTKELRKMIWNWVQNVTWYTFTIDSGCEILSIKVCKATVILVGKVTWGS